MKLIKSALGKLLFPLYYGGAITGCTIFFVVILCKAGVLAGLIFAAVLGIAIGILGGELEYRSHMKELYNGVVRKLQFSEQQPLKNACFAADRRETARTVREPTGFSNKSRYTKRTEIGEPGTASKILPFKRERSCKTSS
jgi:hypothetical protein